MGEGPFTHTFTVGQPRWSPPVLHVVLPDGDRAVICHDSITAVTSCDSDKAPGDHRSVVIVTDNERFVVHGVHLDLVAELLGWELPVLIGEPRLAASDEEPF